MKWKLGFKTGIDLGVLGPHQTYKAYMNRGKQNGLKSLKNCV